MVGVRFSEKNICRLLFVFCVLSSPSDSEATAGAFRGFHPGRSGRSGSKPCVCTNSDRISLVFCRGRDNSVLNPLRSSTDRREKAREGKVSRGTRW